MNVISKKNKNFFSGVIKNDLMFNGIENFIFLLLFGVSTYTNAYPKKITNWRLNIDLISLK